MKKNQNSKENPKLYFYTSLDEMNENTLTYYASLSSSESLAIVNELRKKIAPELYSNKNLMGTKIYFD